jgi:hypothetical protein
MRNLFLLFFFVISLPAVSQEYKDTTFSVRGFTCSCKYNFNTEDDKNIYINDGSGIFSVVGRDAYYPGGNDEWKKFLKKNLNKGFKGNDNVEVNFQVDKNGGLSGFELRNRAPVQKYYEVIRVLKLSGKWFPAIRNGYCVTSSLNLTFEL